MATKIDLIYIEAGGGHRAAANALIDVIHQQQRPWDLRLLCIQDLLDSIDFVRKSVGIQFQDVYNIMLRHGWTLGTKQMVPLMHLLIRMSHRQQVQVLTRHWTAHRPDMVVSLIPHYNRALREALDQGHIILVNLSGGDAVNDADCELLGRLLTRFLFFHVKRRTTKRPFWFYLDECQRYLSGDIPSLLAEARKFYTGVLLSHQWQSQLGKPDDQILAAVHNATNVKIGFRVKHPKEAQEIAEAIIPLDLEIPVRALIKPTVVGHIRTYFDNWSVAKNESWGTSVSVSTSETVTESEGDSVSDTVSDNTGWNNSNTTTNSQTQSYDGWGAVKSGPSQTSVGIAGSAAAGRSGGSATASSTAHSSGRSVSTSRGETTTESYSHGRSESHGASEGLEPIYEDLPSAVHSYQNALYFAAQRLRSLPAGEAFASFVDSAGLHAAYVRVPHVRAVPAADSTFVAIRALLFSRSPSAIETPSAVAQLEQFEAQLFVDAKQLPEANPEPTDFRVPAKRRNDAV